MTKKVGFHTLGCKLNFSETSTIARAFEESGYVRAGRGEAADIYVINTCSVTGEADKKCRNIVRKLIKANPDAIVVVTGCYAQLRPEDLAAIEGVDLVIGNNEKGSIYEKVMALSAGNPQPVVFSDGSIVGSPNSAIAATSDVTSSKKAVVHTCEAHELTEFFAAFSTGDRTRSFLKVQDGCSYHCSYCTIPLARGESRNLPVAEVIREAEKIAASGQREIVLTGINVGDFGRTTGETFLNLLHALDAVDGIDRYRISSIEPNLLTDEILDFTVASRKFQPHFHIPLQSGCDRILGVMRRRYTTEKFAERVEAVRRRIPDVFFGIDVIVGFPGETDEEFETTYRFLESIRPAFLHVFPYSVRPDTPAAAFPDKVSPQTSAARVKRLTELSDRLHRDFCTDHLNRTALVLWESTRRGGFMYGYTENYVKVKAPFERDRINTITEVLLTEFDERNTGLATILETNP